MRRRGRGRRVLKWMGLAATLFTMLLLAVQIWGLFLEYRDYKSTWLLLNVPFPWRGWAIHLSWVSLLMLFTVVPTALLWRVDRRVPPGHCRRCGYDLTGNVSGRCPECGAEKS